MSFNHIPHFFSHLKIFINIVLVLHEFHSIYPSPTHPPASLVITWQPCNLPHNRGKNLVVEAVVCHSGSNSILFSSYFFGKCLLQKRPLAFATLSVLDPNWDYLPYVMLLYCVIDICNFGSLGPTPSCALARNGDQMWGEAGKERERWEWECKTLGGVSLVIRWRLRTGEGTGSLSGWL